MLLLGLFKHDVLALPSDCITTKKKKSKYLAPAVRIWSPKIGGEGWERETPNVMTFGGDRKFRQRVCVLGEY